MKKYTGFFFALLMIATSCNRERNQEPVNSYLLAHNAHDVEKALTYYDENIVFELKGVWIKEGLDQMKSLEKWDSTLNSHLKLESITSSGDTLFCRIIENNDWFGAVNIFDLVHDPAIFVVANGKIKKITGYPSQETGKEIANAVGMLYQWSQQANDSVIFELIQNGEFIYSAEAAEKWLALFERRKSMDNPD